ncbi:XRE family transcriptional regulator [Lactococcus termiticola]|uniref:DNA-binding protein n=1 Tax=Lactococcus termiticola TaxID=2169526 RepID=A0A2R5HFR6_9LACT|nr:XRE family transcriptional regulator [Lactococcus termiticola]GBG96897.1 DNA-binding protein [Lactococcus termiticola]
MEFGQNIKIYRKARGMTQVELCEQLGIMQASYSNWERGKTYPSFENLMQLSDILKVSPAQLLADKLTATIIEALQNMQPKQQEKLLAYAQEVSKPQVKKSPEKPLVFPKRPALTEVKVYEGLSAGTGRGLVGDGDYSTVYTDEVLPSFDVASWVSGDSMEPTYLNGSVVLIKDTGFDYDGAIYAVDVDGSLYIKKVYREEAGLRLVSINKKYDDKYFSLEENPRIIGKVVGNFKEYED